MQISLNISLYDFKVRRFSQLGSLALSFIRVDSCKKNRMRGMQSMGLGFYLVVNDLMVSPRINFSINYVPIDQTVAGTQLNVNCLELLQHFPLALV